VCPVADGADDRGSIALVREALGGLLARWGYETSADALGRRDLRIDLLRGFCMFVMIVDHVGGESSWLYTLTGGNRLYVSAAEGFVLLSGLTLGMIHNVVIHRQGIRAMFQKVFGRAWFLYSATVLLTIAFAAVSTELGTPYADLMTPAQGKLDFTFSVVTFHRTYSLTDILVLYTLLIAAAGPALWLIARGHTGLVLGASAAAWTVAQLSLDRVPRAWQIVDGGFPFSAWQLIFVLGLAIGFHRERLARYLRPRRLVAFGLAAVVALYVVRAIAMAVLGPVGGTAEVHELLFDKNDARLGRILALFAAAAFAYALVTVAWVPLRRIAGRLLLPLGQRALFAYSVQLFAVAFFASDLMAPVRLDRENALFQATAVAMVWLACVEQPRLVRAWDRLVTRFRVAPVTLST
jgi:hypothetical protein